MAINEKNYTIFPHKEIYHEIYLRPTKKNKQNTKKKSSENQNRSTNSTLVNTFPATP